MSGRAIRAEHRQHLADRKGRRRAAAARAPKPGQRGSRRWRQHRRRSAQVEARHRRRVRQAQHEAAKTVVDLGGRAPGRHPRGRRPPRRPGPGRPGGGTTCGSGEWRVGHLIAVLPDKAEAGRDHRRAGRRAGHLLDLPRLHPAGPQARRAQLRLPALRAPGHRDLVAAANIAARNRAAAPSPSPSGAGITHRRAGAHLPGVHPARRDPRRGPHHGHPLTVPWPAPARPNGNHHTGSRSPPRRGARRTAGQNR